LSNIEITIITVTYNSLGTLKEAYSSLLSQSHANWEWVLQDGASTDGTMEWVRSLNDPRILAQSEKDNGIYDALNKAVSRANGDWIGLLHSDDLYPHPDVLSHVMNLCESYNAVYGDLQYVQSVDTSKVLRNWKSGGFSKAKLVRGWMPPHPTLFLKKKLYDLVGEFDTQFNIAADYDFVLRVLSRPELRIIYLPEVLMLMRQGGASSKVTNLLQKSYQDFLVLQKNKFKNPTVTLIFKITRKLPQFLFIKD
jgi:glycosyltransferase